MDFSWVPHAIAEINRVPAGLQIALIGLAYLIVIRTTAYIKKKRNGDDTVSGRATSTRGAVEEFRQEFAPILKDLNDAIRALDKTVGSLDNSVNEIRNLAKKNAEDVESIKATMRDAKEELRRVADIELAIADKINGLVERMVEVRTNLENVIRQEVRKAI